MKKGILSLNKMGSHTTCGRCNIYCFISSLKITVKEARKRLRLNGYKFTKSHGWICGGCTDSK